MKKKKNKAIIIIAFLIILGIFYNIFTKFEKIHNISEEEALKIIKNNIGDEYIEKTNSQALILSKTKNYMTMVVKDQFFLIDFSQTPPKIHQFTSNKPKIKVKVLKKDKDRFLIEHDDHNHWINEVLEENINVGDYIYIKDPHTYLQDNKQ